MTLLVVWLVLTPAAPIHLWYEPEWFPGVEGNFAYWPGPAKPVGHWGIAGPGISAEWSQGGESGWNSIGAAADETKAQCGREILIPRAGKYRVWVRYVEHRRKKTPFTLSLGKHSHLFGERRVLPGDDEYLLYWGFAFAWDSFEADLPAGKTTLQLLIDRKGEAWRQVDAILITTDLKYEPIGREQPWGESLPRPIFTTPPAALPPVRKRPTLAGRDFALWTGIESDLKWWSKQKLDSLRLIDVLYAHSPPADLRAEFHKQWLKADDTPLIGSPHLLPGLYLGHTPDLSPGTALRTWLERTRTPFYIMTNYATGHYTDKTGPATYAALTGPLKEQFLGYIHGEAIGTVGLSIPDKPLGKTRAEQAAGLMKHFRADQARRWSEIYKTRVDESHWARGIPCLSVESTALAHLFYETGSECVGYEVDATMSNIPLRLAFLRGAARQYGRPWIHYASGNFGDACNYFTQEPRVPRGAKGWYHSKYAVTDGVTAGWYRALYHLNYYGGASAIYWEQSLENQWIKPGPGTHPIELSPFGRGTEDFLTLLQKGPAPGVPVVPVAFLLPAAHGYEPTTYRGRMLHHFHESDQDRELRELFRTAYAPTGTAEGQAASPYVQSMPTGWLGNVFDVIVDRPARIKVIHDYKVIYVAGDVDLKPLAGELKSFVEAGGTLVVNVNTLPGLPAELTGVTALPGSRVVEDDGAGYEIVDVKRQTAKPLDEQGLATVNVVGKGRVIVTQVPRLLRRDERAHPYMLDLFKTVVSPTLPVQVTSNQLVLHQFSRNADGLVVMLLNPDGVDKTQSGIARVDRRKVSDVVISGINIRSAHRFEEGEKVPLAVSEPRLGETEVKLRLGPGSLAVIQLTFTDRK